MYVVYTSLAAGYAYGHLGDDEEDCPLFIGSQYRDITRAYPPNYLMTLPADCNYHQAPREWSVLRIRDLVNPPQNWISVQGCFWQYDKGSGPLKEGPNGTYMAASPLLSYPPDILTLDPVWASADCGANAYEWAFDDPPRALIPATALVPKTTEALPPSFSQAGDPGRAPGLGPAPAGVLTADPATMTAELLPGFPQVVRPTLSSATIEPSTTTLDMVPTPQPPKDPLADSPKQPSFTPQDIGSGQPRPKDSPVDSPQQSSFATLDIPSTPLQLIDSLADSPKQSSPATLEMLPTPLPPKDLPTGSSQHQESRHRPDPATPAYVIVTVGSKSIYAVPKGLSLQLGALRVSVVPL